MIIQLSLMNSLNLTKFTVSEKELFISFSHMEVFKIMTFSHSYYLEFLINVKIC